MRWRAVAHHGPVETGTGGVAATLAVLQRLLCVSTILGPAIATAAATLLAAIATTTSLLVATADS